MNRRGQARARRRASRVARPWLAAALALALAALLVAHPAQQVSAQAPSALVSNMGQRSVLATAGSVPIAQAFRTGAHGGGYVIHTIELHNRAVGRPFGVSLWEIDSHGVPTTLVTSDFVTASDFSVGTVVFTAPVNTFLNASTSYAVVVRRSTSAGMALGLTSSNAEDSGAASGWSIGDDRLVGDAVDASVWHSLSNPLRIAITGQTVDSLVSNTGQTPRESLSKSGTTSQTFTSGGNYTITSIEVDSADAEGDEFDVSLWDVDTSRLPKKKVRDLDPPDSFAAGTLEFTVPGGGLKVGNFGVYAVVVEPRDSSAPVSLRATASDSEDSGGKSGWRIADTHGNQATGGAWSASTDGKSLLIRVNGYGGHAPRAPGDPGAGDINGGKVGVQWTAANAGSQAVSGYRIEVSTNAGVSWSHLATAGSTATSYTDTRAGPYDNVRYRVSAFSALGMGQPSDALSVDPNGISLVRNLSQTPASDEHAVADFAQSFAAGGTYTITSIRLAYADAQGDEISASIWEVDSGGLPRRKVRDLDPPDSFAVGTLEFTVPGGGLHVGRGGVYAVVFQAEDSATDGMTIGLTTSDDEDAGAHNGWSIGDSYAWEQNGVWHTSTSGEAIKIGVKGYSGQAPGAPTGLTALATGQSRIYLSWTAPTRAGSSAISGYRIEVSTDGETWTELVADTGSTDTTYAHTGIPAGAARHYRVLAINATGAGPPSDTAMDTANVLVSNASQPVTATTVMGRGSYSQGFTAGSHSDGYALTAIEVVSRDAEGDDFTADLYATDTNGVPTGTATALTAPSGAGAFAAGRIRFTAPAGTKLASGETYAIVINRNGSGNVTLPFYASDAEDPGKASGFSIADTSAFNTFGTWVTSGRTTSLGIAVRGHLNSAPVFADATPTHLLPENTAASRNVGAAVAASDADTEDTLTYTLGGTNAASFTIDSTSGQIQTKSGVAYDFEAKASYTVTVTASDGAASATATVTITITDVDEPPSAPAAPTVSAVTGSKSRLSVTWTAPANTGKPDISGYDIRYRAGNSGNWRDGPQNLSATSATLSSLGAGTTYQVQVRATNDEGDSGWSTSGSGATNANKTPVFADATVTRSIPENTAASRNVGAAVAASDADTEDTLTYTLGGTNAGSFTIDSTSGQIQTRSGVTYDFESKQTYTVTVTASDGAASATATVTITITDVDEPPSAPAAPTVSAVSGDKTRLSVTWTAPANTGKPDISGYDVRYRAGSSGDWSDGPQNVSGTSTTITGLSADTTYQVQVRATNDEGDSGWSASGLGTTSSNRTPVFADATVTRSIPENTAASRNLGAAVAASDADTSDTLTYTLGGTDAASFTIDSTSGQIQTKSGVTYDFEAKASYTVTVTASDGAASATATVTITITDVDEPPSTPAAPTVSAVASSKTSLSVTWTAPVNTGKPDISGYVVRYTQEGGGNRTSGLLNVSGTSTTITGLNPDTTYQVQVRAANDEGDSGWSASGSGTTNDNRQPRFADGRPPRLLTENTAAAQNVGAAVAASDADTEDTLTYTLGGTDAASFTIDSASGQIQTRSGVAYDFESKQTYTVTVTASDGAASATATVTITVTDVDEPPSTPAAPTVWPVAGNESGLSASWTVPANTGKPDISGYDVRYREGSSGDWTDGPQNVSGTLATITGLSAGTTYQVQVRATNDEGDSGWSTSGSGAPVVDAPVFVSFGSATYSATEGGTVSVSVNLIANPGYTIVIPITATSQGGASSADYSGVPASVTFSSGETSQEFTFTATADMNIEDGESVLLGFGASLPAGVNAGTTTASTVSITDTGPVIAITSSPDGGAYTTLDVITVSATFSEAVTVTGRPQLALDIGGTERIAEYAEPGASTGQLLFRYTVQPNDQDDDGIGVKQDALTLNGGAIRASDDSADASLAIHATSFAEHKVDTEIVLIGNMEQTAGAPLRINAGETIKLNFDYGYFKNTFYEGGHILLDVQTPSDTLTLAVTATTIDEPGSVFEQITLYPLSGSVAEAGIQAFRSDDFAVERLQSDTGGVELLLTATGSGYVEIGTTSSTDEDESKAYEWSIGDSFSKSTDGTTFAGQTGDLPRFSVIGHGKEVLRIDAVAVISEPADQAAYTAGEDIEVLVFTNAPPSPTTDSLTIPLQVGANVRQAELVTIGGNFDQHANYRGLDDFYFERQVMHFVYTVQPDDVATGVGIGADPLGSAGIEHAADSRLARDLSFPAQAPAAGSRVNGSRAEACDAVHCAYVTDRYSFLSFKHERYAVAPGGQVTLTLVLDPAYPETLVLPMSLDLPQYYSGTDSQFTMPSSVTFNAGETEKSFTLSVAADTPLTDEYRNVQIYVGFRAFLRGFYSAAITITNSPQSIESSLDTFLHRGYTRPRHTDLLPWSTLSNSTFHYDQRYVINLLDIISYGPAEDDYFDIGLISAQPLSDEALSRLGLVAGGRTFPFSELYVLRFHYPGDRHQGIEEQVGYFVDGEGLRWEKNQRYAVKIIEVPVTATFDAATYAADEGKTVDVTVTLGGGFRGATVTLPISITHNGDATDADYEGVPEQLVFAPGETTKTFTVTVTDDSLDDDDESITLTFGTSEHVKSGGANESATIDLRDDDDPSVTVSFGAATYTVAESDDTGTTEVEEHKVTVTVTLSADPERSVTIPLTKANQGGASDGDYSGVPASVVFASGERSKTFTFTATHDTVDDDGESVKLTFGVLPTGVSAGATKETVVSITDDDDPAVTVSFGAATYTVAESDDTGTTEVEEHKVTVTVTLSADPERSVSIPLTKANQGGATASDYSGVPASVVFASGERSKTFTFTATHDTVDDDGESVKLTFGVLPAGVSAGATKETVVSITDDDDPSVTVNFGAATYTVAESDDTGTTEVEEHKVTVTVTLSADPERSVTIPLTKANQGGASDADYSGVPASVEFASGERSKTFTFTATHDTVDDDGESVKLTFGVLPAGVSAGATKETVVSITDDDDPSVTVSFGAATYTVAESDDTGTTEVEEHKVVVTVTLSADPERSVTIPLTKANQGGASDGDYSGVPASVVFASGERSKTFTFTATHDTVDDDGESVKLTFGVLPAGVSAGATKETVVSITDDDDPSVTVNFGAATYTVAESDDTGTTEVEEHKVTVTVTLSADPERSVTIPLTKANQGGASDADYSGVPASVEFASGERSKTFTFTATHDTVDDDGESVKLTFGVLPAGVSAGAIKETVVSITDDDQPATVTVSFGAASYHSTEGVTAANVVVTLNEDPERTVVIPLVTTNKGGASSSDYSGVPASVTFNAGDTSKTFALTATEDNLVESGEQVEITFGVLPSAAVAGTPAKTTVSLSDSTQAQTVPPTVHFGASTYTVAEGGSVSVSVTLSKAPGSDLVIPISAAVQGGASSGDYSGVPANVTFGATDTSQTITFTATEDTDDDDGESVKLTFGTLPNGVTATSGQAASTTVSITDDDDPSVTVSFGAATYTVAESDDTGTTEVEEHKVVVTVTLSADPERSVTIPLTATNQGGASDGDYSGVPASVVFASGERSKTFTFTATHDTVDDDGESVKLTFGVLPTGVSAGATKETVVSITDDDDPAVTVSFGAATYTVAESDDTGTTEVEEHKVTVTVTLSADPERSVSIPLTKANQGGATASDYSGVPASVVFASGERSKTFTFTATHDTVDDDGESVKLTFGVLPAGVSAGATKETVVSITDDDDPSVTVNFGAATYTVAESDDTGTTEVEEHKVTVTVTLSADPERSVTIPLTKANQGGASDADYSGVPASVEFASGERSKTFTFTATHDTVDDDGESVKLTFGVLPAGVSAGATKETVVSITDDDDPSVTVSFGAATYTVAESDDTGTTEVEEHKVVVTVTLSADPERSVTIPLTKANQGGASDGDYSGVPASVVFASGERSKTFTFTATHDTVDDDGESVKLTFGVLPAGVSAGATKETVVSITDDDDPSVTVNFGAATYTVAESDDTGTTEVEEHKVTVTVTLSADPERSVTIPLTKANQGGASDADYSGVPASVEFASGERSKTFTFTATHDTVDDDGESVKLTFGVLPAGVSAGAIKETVVSITDDDQPATVTVSFGAASYHSTEGVTAANVVVTLNEDPERTVVIPLVTTNKGGASSSDYSGVPASVTFNAGDTSKTFALTATEDNLVESGEQVEITFGVLPSAAVAGTPAKTTVSLSDSTQAQTVPPTVHFGASTYTVAEGGSVSVSVTLSKAPGSDLVIPISAAVQGGASSGDYSGVPANVTFGATDTSQTITFTATEDTDDDDGESVKLTFGTLPNGVTATSGQAASTTVSITDDDDPSVTVSFGAATYTVAESDDTGTTEVEEHKVVVTVTLSADPERSVTIPLTATNQGGASDGDYSGVPASVVFASGERSKTFTFTATHDTVDDDGESVKLTFGVLPTGVSAGATKETVVSITDDDDPAVTVSFGAATYTVAESDDTGTTEVEEHKVTVTVTLSADPERSVSIPLTKANQGGATASDYSGVPASVVFASGERSKTFTFTATHDTVDDDGESVKLTFGVLPAGVSAGATKETVVSITDDDDPSVTVNFGAATYTVAESDDTGTTEVEEHKVTVTVTLSADPERSVTIPLTKANQGGASDADYSGVPASVEFASGERSKTFTFTATHDTVDDDGESVKLTFGVLPTGVSAGATKETVVSITDDDDPAVTVSFGAASYSVAEGGAVVVTVTLSADPERSVTIPLSKTNQDGASSSDYSGVPSNVEFASGETSKTFTFTAAADTVDDDGESVKLTFGTKPAGVSEGTPKETVISITDDCTTGAIWCVDIEFNLGSDWHALWNKAVTPSTFSYNGVQYDMYSTRFDESPPDRFADPDEIRPPFGIPERTGLAFNLEPVGGDCVPLEYHGRVRCDPRVLPNDDPLDWVLHVTTIKDGAALTAALPFSEARHGGSFPMWKWFGRDLHDLAMAWSEGQTYRFRLVHEPRADRTLQPPGPPLYLRQHPQVPVTYRYLWLLWVNPQMRDDTEPLDVTYKVQWKLSSGSWDTPADVSERSQWAHSTSFEFRDLAAGSEYDIRIIASNSAGDGPPSNVFTHTRPAAAQNTPGNRAAEGAPTISGTARVGETLSVSTAGISDADGLERARFAYRWLLDGSELGATRQTYTVVEGAVGRALSVRVTFTDDAGYEESLTSAPTAAVVDSLLEVESATVDGATLKLNYPEFLNTLVDLPEPAFTVTVNGSAVTVSEATVSGSAVTLALASAVAAGDSVTVGYAKPAGYTNVIGDVRGRVAESFSGRAVTNETPPPPLTASARRAPESHDGSATFTFELHFSEEPDVGYRTLRDHAFTETGGEVTKARRLTAGSNLGWEITVRPSGSGPVTLSLPATADCAAQGAICTSEGKALAEALEVAVPGQGRSPQWLTPDQSSRNMPATGAPVIRGTAQVGETLTASTSGIADAEGLSRARFSYRWLADGQAVAGAIASSYTLVASDEGKAITVRVSFTDDAGHSETLTSAPTAAVAPPPLRASARNAPESHDGSAGFTFELHFSEQPELSYATLRDHALQVTGGEVTKARRLTPGSNLGWEITVRPSSTSAVTVVLPVTTDCSAEGAVCTGGGKRLSEQLEVTVPGP